MTIALRSVRDPRGSTARSPRYCAHADERSTTMSDDDPESGVVVIFDIDGTLLDSVGFHHAALLATFASLGVGLGSRSLSEFPHYTDSAIFSQLVEESRGAVATAGELERLDERLDCAYARLRFASAVSP